MKYFNFLKNILIHSSGKGYSTKLTELKDITIAIPNKLTGYKYGLLQPTKLSEHGYTCKYISPSDDIRACSTLIMPDNHLLECVIGEVEQELNRLYEDNKQIKELRREIIKKDAAIQWAYQFHDTERLARMKAEGLLLHGIFTGAYRKIKVNKCK